MTSKIEKQVIDVKLESDVVEKEKDEKPVSEVVEVVEEDEKDEKDKKIQDYRLAWASEMMTCRHIEEKVLGMTNKFSTLIDDCEALYKCIPDKKLQEWLVKGINGFHNEYVELIKDITAFREQRQRAGWQTYGRGEYVIAMLKFNQEYAPDKVTESDMKILEQLEKKSKNKKNSEQS
jgi:hypothetical protein